MLALANRAAEEKAAGQSALFGEAEAPPLRARAAPWSAAERLRREFDAVGFFLSGHPLEAYDAALKRLRATRWADFARAVRGGATTARLGASVLDRAERRTKNGTKIGVVQLSDPSGQYEAIMFQEGLSQYPRPAGKGRGRAGDAAGQRRGRGRARAHRPGRVADRGRRQGAQGPARLRARRGAARFDRERLRASGEGEVSLVVMLGPQEGEVEVRLPGRYAVTGAIAGALKAVAGVVAVEHV